MWNKVVDVEEGIFRAGSFAILAGLKTYRSISVKPSGSFKDPLVFSSYPALHPDSTVHLDYGMSNDLSNQCIAQLYLNFGFHLSNKWSTGLLHVEAWSRWLDRKRMAGPETSVLDRLPKPLKTQ